MGKRYNQLSFKDRVKIQTLSELGMSARKIAVKMGRSNKTISTEIERCQKGEYCAEEAHSKALRTKALSSKYTKFTQGLEHTLKDLLGIGFSPEQISGRLSVEFKNISISTNTLYAWTKKLGWSDLLPRKGKPYKKRSASEAGARLIPDRKDIRERPKVVDLNTEIGHWEGDTVYGQDGYYFVTLVERVSKLFLTSRVKSKSKKVVTRAIKRMLKPYKSICKSITFDNGGEFAAHKEVSKSLNCDIYFAQPYRSWQRGLNENSNGLLRRFFPKGMKIGNIPEKVIKNVQLLLNTRPRKALKFLSPYEFLIGKRVSLIGEV